MDPAKPETPVTRMSEARLPPMPYPIEDQMLIRRVANGWIILPGPGVVTEFTHVAITPKELAEHVACWANAQTCIVKP